MKEDSKEKLFRNIKSKIDFNRNILLFKAYLSSLYTHITNNNPHHFNLYTLYHLTQWPLFIAEKVYAYFIKASNQSKLTNSLFCDRMLSLYYSTLKEFEKELTPNFLRCHKSYMVNMNFIAGYEPYKFLLKNSK